MLGGECIYADCALPKQPKVRLCDETSKETKNKKMEDIHECLCLELLGEAVESLKEEEMILARSLPLFEVAGSPKGVETNFISLRHTEESKDEKWYLKPPFNGEEISGVRLDKTFLKAPDDKHKFSGRFYEKQKIEEFGKRDFLQQYVIDKIDEFEADEQDKVSNRETYNIFN